MDFEFHKFLSLDEDGVRRLNEHIASLASDDQSGRDEREHYRLSGLARVRCEGWGPVWLGCIPRSRCDPGVSSPLVCSLASG